MLLVPGSKLLEPGLRSPHLLQEPAQVSTLEPGRGIFLFSSDPSVPSADKT